jgi:glycine/D-amino acid oxidase-like deaminating enzyme
MRCCHPGRRPQTLKGTEQASVVIVGAGYTGLAAARRWAQLRPDDQVMVLDAATVGEGSPGRNSGFMLEIALADDADAGAVARMNAMNALCRDTMGELAALVANMKSIAIWRTRGPTAPRPRPEALPASAPTKPF